MEQLTTQTTYFADLAAQYFPHSTKENARRNLNNHIRKCTELYNSLIKTGYGPWNHRILTPLQHRLILEYLGDTDNK